MRISTNRVRQAGRGFRRGLAALACALALGACGPGGQTLEASEAVRKELAAVAASVGTLLKAQQQDSIAIGEFTGPPNFPTSGGPGLVKLLTEELAKQGISVKKRAPIGIKGEFSFAEATAPDSAEKRLALRIVLILVDQFGRVLANLAINEKAGEAAPVDKGKMETLVRDETAIAQFTGLPVVLPADEPAADRDHRLRESMVEPPSRIVQQSRVFAGPGSPYGIEISVTGQPRAATLEDDLPFVRIDRGEVYQIRLINDSSLDAAVNLAIDGIGVFAFSDVRQTEGPQKGDPLYAIFVIPARSTVAIKGWHRTNKFVDSFLVSEYAKSAAASLNSSTGIGTITACFHAAWPTDAPPPADEPPAKKGQPNATARGPREEQEVKEVQRRIGVLRASVTVRYSKASE